MSNQPLPEVHTFAVAFKGIRQGITGYLGLTWRGIDVGRARQLRVGDFLEQGFWTIQRRS